MHEPETILLTGASGFLGSHLVRKLLAEKYKVLAYKRKTTDFWRLADIVDQITWFDVEELERPFKFHKITHLIHLATSYGRNDEKSSDIVLSNVVFPMKLFELAELFEVKTFFNTDTFFTDNSQLYQHLSYYTASKKHFYEWLRIIVKNVKVINVKLEHVYGPNDGKKFIPYVIEQCYNNIPELPLTLGEQKRDFVYVDDVANGYLCLLKNIAQLPKQFNKISIGSGNSVSIRMVVEMIAKKMHSKTKLLFGALPYCKNEIMDSVADLSKLRELQWSPRYTLQRGLQETITAFLNNIHK